MAKRKHKAEEIINKLREAEVVIATGNTVAEAARRMASRSRPFTAGGPSTVVSGWTRRGARSNWKPITAASRELVPN